MRLYIRYLVCALALCFGTVAQAQQIQVSAKIDSTNLLIGEQTYLHLEARVGEGVSVIFPTVLDTLVAGVEVLEVSPIDTVALKGGLSALTQKVLVTSYDSALYFIPPFKFVSMGDTLLSKATALKVMTLPVDVESKQFFDIKPVEEPDFVLADYLPEILFALFWLILIAVGVYLYKRWQQRKIHSIEEEYQASLLPAAEEARLHLAELKEKQLWQKGMEKEYHTSVTHILRTYIHRRYDVNALEMTTAEIVQTLRSTSVSKDLLQQLRSIMELSDFVKFAKYRPLPEENEKSAYVAEVFVDHTEEKVVVVDEQNESNPDEQPKKEMK